MEETKLTNTQTLFKSFINNKILFERRKNSILYPIIILVIIIFLLSVPSYFMSKSIEGNKLMKNFPKVEEPIKTILTSSLDCSVKNGILSCSDETPVLNSVIGEDIKYTVIVNQKAIALDTEIVYSTPKVTDNLIILYSQTIRIRYSQRDHVNQKVITNEIIGDYSTLENFNLKEISQRIENNPDSASKEVENFITKVYNSTLDTQLIVNLSSSIVSFMMLVIVTCIILKGSYLFKIKKGFKFSECFKISLTSALPCIVLSLFASLLFGFSSFASIFGLIFVCRILFIYFKYIFNNKIFKEIYEKEKDERFNV